MKSRMIVIISPLAILIGISVFLFALGSASCGASGQEHTSMLTGTVNAPEFPSGLEWLNVDRPLSLGELRGKVVLLDFWTYCCINCMHIIPDLKRLEEKYAAELVVIGVHSAKFTTERETENIRQAILRYEIEHPVVNDSDLTAWRLYSVRAWPTVALIDPEGKLVGIRSGEGVFDAFDGMIARLVETFDAEGKIDRRPLQLALEQERMPASLLSFPGKVLADAATGRLFIADSNHNRVVVVSIVDSSVMEIIGTGAVGFNDGEFGSATFNHPQGMAVDGEKLYVADTENHAIRLVDFERQRVTTLAGVGGQARAFNAPGPALETPLSSPWDLVLHGGSLYIAMAGAHQIWRLDLASNYAEPFAGSGREARIDGPLPAAALAQPSGLATDGLRLYIADSEVSSVRAADLNADGRVETLVGGDLFDFGDRDGRGLDVRLQHPLGVAYHGGYLYVADTYNNKIKRIRLSDNTAETLLGTGEAGAAEGDRASFDEPGGVSVAGGKLYIADTNNHVIRVADLSTRRVETLLIRNAEMLRTRISEEQDVETIRLPGQEVAPEETRLVVYLELPISFKLNELATSSVTIDLGDGEPQTFSAPQFPIELNFEPMAGESDIQVVYAIYYCREGNEGLCYFKEGRLLLPLKVQLGASNGDLEVIINAHGSLD